MAKGSGGSDSKGSSSSGGSSKGASSSSSSNSKSGTPSTGSTAASRNSGGGYSGFGGGGEGGSRSTSTTGSASPSASSPAGGARAAAGGGSISSASSSTASASRSTTSASTGTGRTAGATATGTIGNGLAAGLTGSGLADKGGRVTGGFDSGRFGDTPAADKGGRVTGAQTAGKTTASPDPGRFGASVTAEKGDRVATVTGSISRQPTASVGRQSSVGGAFANGGINSGVPTASPREAIASVGRQSSINEQYNNGGINAGQVAPSARVGNGLAVGLSAPSVSARDAESRSMGALAASRTPAAGTARRAEDASMSALDVARTPMAERGGRVVSGAAPVGNGLAAGIDPARFGDSVMAERGGRVAPSAATASISPPTVSARAAEDQSMARQKAWDGLLGTVRASEAQKATNPATGKVDPYNGLVGAKQGAKAPTHANLTGMTIAEVQRYQSGMAARGHLSTAVGAYQMRASTLAAAAKLAGMDPATTKFSVSTQDQLARTLADDVRASQAAKTKAGLTAETYAAKLSDEWAAFEGPIGRGRYDRDGVNKATVSYDRVAGVAGDLVASGAVGQARTDRAGRFERTYLSSADDPTPAARPTATDQPATAREAVTALADRGPGIGAIAPSLYGYGPGAGTPATMPGLKGTVASFDRTGLKPETIAVAEAMNDAVPGLGINSGYRTREQNTRAKGATESQHLYGRAVDVNLVGLTDQQKTAALEAAVQTGARGVGIYPGGRSLHVDTRPGAPAMWGGNPAGAYKGVGIDRMPDWAQNTMTAFQGASGSKVTPAQGPMPTARPDPNEVSRVGANSILADTGPDPVPGGSARTASRSTVATPRAPAAERFAEKYLGTSPTTGAPTSQPRSATPTPIARAAEVAAKTTPARSAVDKVVSGAIDVGVGLLPGIGPAAAIYGAAAPFLGLPTVGDLALNLRDTNDFDLKTALRTPESNTGNTREMADVRERLTGSVGVQGAETPSAAAVPTSTFAEKYLAFSDPTPRPTPSQKWGGSGANSVPYTP